MTSASITIPGTNEVLTYTSGGTVVVPVHDGLGTPIGLVNSPGLLGTRYIYNPFGGFQTQGPSNSSFPFRMGGIEYDSDTGLYHTLARYYSPTLQRFLSEDPLGYGGGGVNFFAYSGNDPVNGSDPSGMDAEGEQGIVGGGFGFHGSFGFGGIKPDTLYIRHDAKYQLLFSQRQMGVVVNKISEGVRWIRAFLGGTQDFARNYEILRRGNWKKADKYFHCKANCEAAKRGPGGVAAAKVLSDVRAFEENWIYGWFYPHDTGFDQAANDFGRRNGAACPGIPCSVLCNPFRYPWIPQPY